MDIDLEIKEKTRKIIDYLGFYDRRTSGTELENIIKTYKYVVQNIKTDLNFRENPNSSSLEQNYKSILLRALVNNPGLPTDNCILLSHLFSGIDVNNRIVLCESTKTGKPHICVLARIKREFYYFDPTLEKAILDENTLGSGKKLLLCAAMGRNEYEKFYQPIKVLKKPNDRSKDSFPKNIADESIGKVIINAINHSLPKNLIMTVEDKQLDNSETREVEL